MDTKTVTDKLQYLLGTLCDGQNGFKDAADHATAADIKALFTERSAQRAAMAAEIEQKLITMGEQPRGSSVGAALHRTAPGSTCVTP